MRTYDLIPTDGRKSFYGKAVVVENGGTRTLWSYGTAIVREKKDGSLVRMWSGWSATTGRHIKAFCGLNKTEFMQLPMAR